MREFLHRSRHAAVFLLVLLAGCSDDDPVAPRFSGESAGNTAAAAAQVVHPIENSQGVADNLFVAILSLIDLSADAPHPVLSAAALPFRAGAASDLGGAIALTRAAPPPAAGAMMGLLIPDALEGSTLVWDLELHRYVVDEAATGAPANGVRFVYYATDFRGALVVPLTPLGHIDLVDASTTSSARLEIEAVRSAGNVTLADYFVRGSASRNLVSSTIELASAGYISDGEERVDFELSWLGTGTGTTSTVTTSYFFEGDAGSLDLDIESFESATLYAVEGTFTVEHGNTTGVFAFEGENERIEGVFTYNGTDVALFSGSEGNPTFTNPDGDPLSVQELQALVAIWGAFLFTNFFAYTIVTPFLIVLAYAMG